MSTPSIGLVLGGGGARGFAHIPVLEVFEEMGVRPKIVVGTSIGAIIGAAYCAGHAPSALREHVLAATIDPRAAMSRLLDARAGTLTEVFMSLANPLTLDGEKLLDIFWPEGIPSRFDELQIPLYVVATDFFAHKGMTFVRGDLRSAVAASMAVPGLIRPVSRGGKTLIDGGVVNPLPVNVATPLVDYVIAVDVTAGPQPDKGKTPGSIELTAGTIQIMQEAIVEARLMFEKPHALIKPDVRAFSILDFFKAPQILEAGDAHRGRLREILSGLLQETAPAQPSLP